MRVAATLRTTIGDSKRSATIKGTISINDGYVFVCHDNPDFEGFEPPDKKGHRYGWCVLGGYEDEVTRSSVVGIYTHRGDQDNSRYAHFDVLPTKLALARWHDEKTITTDEEEVETKKDNVKHKLWRHGNTKAKGKHRS